MAELSANRAASQSMAARFAAQGLVALMLVLLACLAAAPSAIAKSPVATTLDQLVAADGLEPDKAAEDLKIYSDARKLRAKLSGPRRAALSYTISVAEALARSDRLTADRTDPVFLIIKRNTSWFGSNGPVAEGTRRRFGNSRIYFQYFAGRGWQFHPLANFSKLNAVWTDKSAKARRALASYAAELVELSVVRGGFTTWEYYFLFDGGKPPWISAISQGTAIQSFARSGKALNDPGLTEIGRSAVDAFAAKPPTGLRIPYDDGSHYLIYSFARKLLVLNTFLQSLIGLHDYATITGDSAAAKLYDDGDKAARAQTPSHDTGAWSLYAKGRNESTLSYHKLLTGFLTNMCEDTKASIYCDTEQKFVKYTKTPPTIKQMRVKIAKGRATVRFKLSKISRVGVTISKGGRMVSSTSASFPYGKRAFRLAVPKKSGLYVVKLTATDLAGNWQKMDAKVRVKKGKKK